METIILMILCIYSIITYIIASILVVSTFNYKYNKEREVIEAFLLIVFSPVILPILVILAILRLKKQ